MKKYFSEFVGTFALLFLGCGAILLNQMGLASMGSMGISLVFGFTVMVMIYSLGDISGAHFNPAVSFGFWQAGRLSFKEMALYMLSQSLGALSALIFLKLTFPMATSFGTTMPAAGLVLQAYVIEVILTAMLMFVILSVSTGSKEKGIMAGLAIGTTVALGALVGGSVSGASMNPARTLAPALVSGEYRYLWIYLTAPFVGSCLAVWVCKGCQKEGCCA